MLSYSIEKHKPKTNTLKYERGVINGMISVEAPFWLLKHFRKNVDRRPRRVDKQLGDWNDQLEEIKLVRRPPINSLGVIGLNGWLLT